MLKRILMAGLKTGGVLSVTVILSVMASSKRDSGNGWNAVNAICHVIDGDDISQPSGFQPRESLLGIAANSTAMAFWGVLYEAALLLTKTKSNPATAIAGAAAAYAVDYHLVPERLKPGIEKRMGPAGLFMTYAAFAVTLALSPLWNDYEETRPLS